MSAQRGPELRLTSLRGALSMPAQTPARGGRTGVVVRLISPVSLIEITCDAGGGKRSGFPTTKDIDPFGYCRPGPDWPARTPGKEHQPVPPSLGEPFEPSLVFVEA